LPTRDHFSLIEAASTGGLFHSSIKLAEHGRNDRPDPSSSTSSLHFAG